MLRARGRGHSGAGELKGTMHNLQPQSTCPNSCEQMASDRQHCCCFVFYNVDRPRSLGLHVCCNTHQCLVCTQDSPQWVVPLGDVTSSKPLLLSHPVQVSTAPGVHHTPLPPQDQPPPLLLPRPLLLLLPLRLRLSPRLP